MLFQIHMLYFFPLRGNKKKQWNKDNFNVWSHDYEFFLTIASLFLTILTFFFSEFLVYSSEFRILQLFGFSATEYKIKRWLQIYLTILVVTQEICFSELLGLYLAVLNFSELWGSAVWFTKWTRCIKKIDLLFLKQYQQHLWSGEVKVNWKKN